MAPPRILLSSAEAPDINDWVPPSYAQNHENLARLARALFGHKFPGDDWDVHFHLAALDIGASTCIARLIPQLWNNGDYFTHDFTMTEELYLYAHFEPKARVSAGRQTFIEPTIDPDFLEAGTECLSMQEIREGGLPGLHSQSGPAESLDLAYSGPVLDRLEDAKPQAKLQARPKKKSKSESKSKSKSKSRSKSKSKSKAEPKPVGKRTSSLMPQYTTPNRDLTVYPALPADATPENYVKDKEFAMTDNTRDVFLTSGRTMESLSANRAYTICKARLIAGKYGVTARKPCDFCKARNRTCRIMHPALHTEPWHAVKPPGSGKVTNRCACCSHLYKAHCNAE